jgi:hypothetical protein
MSGRIAGMLLLVYLTGAIHTGTILPAQAEETAVLSGKVSDAEGRPVEGARVFLYDSNEVRRSANYISAPTNRDGLYRMVAPPGRYWSMARLKRTEGYGALMPGDRHSGDPVEIEISRGKGNVKDFIVADLKEAMKLKTRERERLIRISGRIIDENGSPVPGAYAIAHRNNALAGMPDHLSAFVDKDGRYTLYLPKGKYYIGSALSFPPGPDHSLTSELSVDADRSDVDIMRKSR